MAIEKVLSCRLNDADFEKLDRFAAEIGMSRTQAIRYLIRIPKEVRDIQVEDNGVIVFSLGTIHLIGMKVRSHGYNLNQIAHALNTIAMYYRRGDRLKDSDVDNALAEVRDRADILQGQYEELLAEIQAIHDRAYVIQFGAPRNTPKKRGRPRKNL